MNLGEDFPERSVGLVLLVGCDWKFLESEYIYGRERYVGNGRIPEFKIKCCYSNGRICKVNHSILLSVTRWCL